MNPRAAQPWGAWALLAALLVGGAAAGARGAAGSQVDPVADAWEQISQGRLVEVLATLPELGDPAAAARLEVEVWYRARDFARSRRLARKHLESEPLDAFVALRASAASLWLADGDGALSDLERLRRAIAEGVEDGARAAWEAEWENQQASARQLIEREAAAERAHRRLKRLALVLLGAAGVLLALLAARPGTVRARR